MIEKIHWLGHASFRIEGPDGMSIYFDPYHIKPGPKAGLILVTHDHFDHCSPEDLSRLATQETVIIGPGSIAGKCRRPVRVLTPGKSISANGIEIEGVPAYNPKKDFHPRSAGNLGFIITVGGLRIYHAGDTDLIPEMKGIKADVALLPIGGTYTMDAPEAAKAAELIDPKVAIPMHFGTVVGSHKDAQEFKRLCKVEVEILEPEDA